MVGISKTEVGDSLDLLVDALATLGYCQPDGTFITTLADLRERLAEQALSGEAVVVDGLATGCSAPAEGPTRRPGMTPNATPTPPRAWRCPPSGGDLLWRDGGWPGSCHEHELVTLSGLGEVLDTSGVASLLDRGFRAWPRIASTGIPRSGTAAPRTGSPTRSGPTTAARQGYARWWSSRSVIWPTPGRYAAGGPVLPPPGHLPRCRGAGLPRPVAAPSPHMTELGGHPQCRAAARPARGQPADVDSPVFAST
jgi:hypothetical protein